MPYPDESQAIHTHPPMSNGYVRYSLLLIPLFLGFIILMSGGVLLIAQGLVLGVVGMGLLVYPPRYGLGQKGDLAAIGLFMLPLLGFLPAFLWFKGDWRAMAIDQHDILLPYTIAPSVRAMAEQTVWLWAAIGAFYLLMNIYPHHRERKLLELEWVIIVFLLSMGVLFGHAYSLKYIYAPHSPVFSYFPSRNQTATVLFLGGIIAFGLAFHAAMRKQVFRCFLYGLMTFVILAATVTTTSRAGVLIFAMGCLTIMAVYARQWRSSLLLKIGIPFVVIFLSVLILMGGTLQRIMLLFQDGDFRLDIYRDTLRLIIDHPLTGVGLGNFEWVIGFYRHYALIAQRLLQPESDILWWVSELGLLLIPIGVFLGRALIQAFMPLKHNDGLSSRVIFVVAIGAFGVHSLIDVPMHFFGSLLPVLFLCGLASYPHAQAHILKPIYFRLMGTFLCIIGLVWLIASLWQKPWHRYIIQDKIEKNVELALQKNNPTQLQSVLSEALEHDRFNWWLYFNRGQLSLWADRNPLAAEKDFLRALFLEPVSATVPYYIGLNWLPYAPQKAYEAWLIALHHQSANLDWLFEDMRKSSIGYPSFQPYLALLSEEKPTFRAQYLLHASPEDLSYLLPQELEKNPHLQAFEPKSRQRLFELWAKASPQAYLDYASQTTAWVPTPWLCEAYAWAALSDWQKAVTLADQNTPSPVLPTPRANQTLSEALRSFKLNPKDIWIAQNLLSLQIQHQDWPGIQETLSILETQKPTPAYVYYWLAQSSQKGQDFKKAWDYWLLYWQEAR